MSFTAMCIQGSVMIAFVLIVRGLLGKRLPSMAFYALWLIVLARLLVPVAIPLPVGPWASLEQGASAWLAPKLDAQPGSETSTDASAVAAAKPASEAAPSAVNAPVTGTAGQPTAASGRAAFEGAPSASESASVRASFSTGIADDVAGFLGGLPLGIIWAVGAGVCALGLGTLYAGMLIALRRNSREVEHPVARAWLARHRLVRPLSIRSSALTRSPFTYGIVRPIIVVPPSFAWDGDSQAKARELILAHELTHVRRFDPLLKVVLAATACLYWFNPLVWALYLTCLRDIELSCDELVTRRLSGIGRRAYALSLLSVAETRRGTLSLASAFGSSPLSTRVTAVMRHRAPSAPAIIASVALALACILACVTTAPSALASAEPDVQASPTNGAGEPARLANPASTPETADNHTAAPDEAPTTIEEPPSAGSKTLPLHGDSPLVSELATDEGTCLRTPRYSVVIPTGFPLDSLSWEFTQQGTDPLPADAFDVLAITDASGRVAAYAFCTPLGDGSNQPSWVMDEPAVPGYRFFSSAFVNDWSGRSWVYVSDELVNEMGGIDAPGVRSSLPYHSGQGSLSMIYGLAEGQASREAYIAYATQEEGGVRVHVPGYSILLPASFVDDLSFYQYTDHSYDGAPGIGELLFATSDGEMFTVFKATSSYDPSSYGAGADTLVTAGISSDGLPIIVNPSTFYWDDETGEPAPDPERTAADAARYASWVRAE